MGTLTYHRRRASTHRAMADDAGSAVARIAHGKLAALHARSADRAAAATLRADAGMAPLLSPVEL